MMLTNQLTRETTIDAPIERVWAILAEPQHLAAWWASGGAEVDPQPGGAIVFRWLEHGTFHARVTAIEPPRRFAFRWALIPDEEPRDDNATDVTFTLTPAGSGTLLRVVETGFARLGGGDVDRAQHLEENRQGWEGTFAELASYIRQPVA